MASESDKTSDAVLSESNDESMEAESSDKMDAVAEDPKERSSDGDVMKNQETDGESMEQLVDDPEESSSGSNITKELETAGESMEQVVEDPEESSSGRDITKEQETGGGSMEQLVEDPEESSSGSDITKEQETDGESMERVVEDTEVNSSGRNIMKEQETAGESMEQVVEDPEESSSGRDITKEQETDDECEKHEEPCETIEESKKQKIEFVPDNSKELDENMTDAEVQEEKSSPEDDDKSDNIVKSSQKHQVIYKKVGETITVEITEAAKKQVTRTGLKRIELSSDGSKETTTSSSLQSVGKTNDQTSKDSIQTETVDKSDQGRKLPGEHDIFVCKVCRKYFVYTALKKHVVEHTKTDTEVCCACGYFNKDGGKVSAHPNCNVCWECRLIFKSSQPLKDHLEWHKQQQGHEITSNKGAPVTEKDSKIIEHDYSKTYGDQQMEVDLDEMEAEEMAKEAEIFPMTIGQSLPHEDDVLECRLCKKYFVYSSLKKHVKQEHTSVKTGVCSACGFFDIRGGKLKDHPNCFVCWGCSVSFKCGSSLQQHMAWHHKVGEQVITRKEAVKLKKAGGKKESQTATTSPVIAPKGEEGPIKTSNKTAKKPLETTTTVEKSPVRALDSKQKSNSTEQVLECRFCNDFFLYSSLKVHAIEHTKKETEVCPKCGYYEKTGGPMKKHPSCFVCWTCNIFFNSNLKLKEHMQLHDIPDENNEWHMCLICMARFCHSNGLKEHMRWHDGEHGKMDAEMRRRERKARMKQWGEEGDSGKRQIKIKAMVTKDEEDTMKLCVRCNMFFMSLRSLKRHVKNAHTKTDTDLCDKCGFFEKAGGPVGLHDCKKEIGKLKRKAGKKTRDSEGRYKCDLCAKTYAFSQGLRAHMATHVPKEDRPYCCEHCPKKFAKKILLQDHLRVHTGEKPFLCHMCAKTFRSGANLRQHSRRCKGAVSKHPLPTKPPQPITVMSQPAMFGYPNPQVRFFSKQAQSEDLPTLTPAPDSVVYEVQMQVNEEGDSTVVINLDNIGEIKTYTQNADNQQYQNDVEMEEVVQVDFDSKMNTQQTSKDQVYPVKIHASPVKPSHSDVDKGGMKTLSEDHKGDLEEETISPSQGGNTNEVVQDDLYDVIDNIEVNSADDDDDDWEPDEGPAGDSETATDKVDHDYINVKEKPSSSVLEEKQNQDIQKPRLLEIMHMCPLCKGLFESKLDIKEHIKSIHKKETKYDGIVVLALPRGKTSNPEDSESDSDSEDEFDENQDTLPLQWSYSCSHCHELFAKNEIDDHLKSVVLKKGQCPTCFRIHKGQSKVKKSLVRCRLSRARKVYQCPYCNDIKRVTLAELKGHLKNRHELTEYSCTLCDKSFKSKRSMAVHMKVHVYKEPKEKKRYICEKCNRELNDRIALRIHRMQHENPKPFQCKLCPKAYSFPNGLKVHMRGHNNDYPYLCEYCSRSFKTKHCLMCHIRTHTGIKPFVCDGCDKKFRTKGNLRQHTQRCTAVARKEEFHQLEQIHPINVSQGQDQMDMTPAHSEQIEITSADLGPISIEEIKMHLHVIPH